MKLRLTLFLTVFMLGSYTFRPPLTHDGLPAYIIFESSRGKAIDFDKMMKGLKKADVIFFGEIHNNSICHWLQLQVLKALCNATDWEVIIGAEMFETDDQLLLNEYLHGMIKREHFENEAKIWHNYRTDYAPLVEYAKMHDLPFIATNIPRRYANIVARGGFKALEELSDHAKNYMAPLPPEVDYDLSTYKEMVDMMANPREHQHKSIKNIVDAQAIKDATMAHFISKYWSTGKIFYHINGSYHSKNGQGIVHYLQKYKPDLSLITIIAVEQEKIDTLGPEHRSLADYVIAIPSDMTKTY